MASNAQSFASSASLLVALQLGSRLFTFGLNQALLRFVSPRAFGTAAIQFELLSSTILFLSREGFRNALIRAWNDKDTKDGKHMGVPPDVANLTLLPAIIGIPVSALASVIYRSSCSKETSSQPYFDLAVAMYALASCLELGSEPLHIRTMGRLLTSLRVRAEGIGIIIKTAVTFLVILLGERVSGQGAYALAAFASGQLAYALTLIMVYLGHYGLKALKPQLQPGPINKSFNAKYLKLTLSMTTQSVFKHVLTEGDKFMVSRISALEDQGGYALANNYGSLVARILFQPIEEMTRVFFSKTLAGVADGDKQTTSTNSNTASSHQVNGSENTSSDRQTPLHKTSQVLSSILSAQVGAAFVLCSFGPPFLPLLLQLGLPRRYLATSAPELLQAWIWYIPILAVNGVLEAFVSSVATPSDIHRQSRWMAAFSAIFVLATGLFYRSGLEDASLIYANIVNLVSRIIFAAHFISQYYRQHGNGSLFVWSSVLPRWPFIALVGLSGFTLRATAAVGMDDLKQGRGFNATSYVAVLRHFATGGCLAIVCIAVWWVQTGRYLVFPDRKRA